MLHTFRPLAKTGKISCTSTASSGAQVATNAPAEAVDYLLFNNGTSEVFLNWGDSASDATAALPTGVGGSAARGIWVPAGAQISVRLNQTNLYFSAICNSGESTELQITPGLGL